MSGQTWMTEIPLWALEMFTWDLPSGNFLGLMVFPSADAYIFIVQWTQGNCVQISRARLILASSLTLLVWFCLQKFSSSNTNWIYFTHFILLFFLSLVIFCYYSSVNESSSSRTSALRSFRRKEFHVHDQA